MKYIEIKSPAKINIGLDIISKRADGYHNLQTIFYPLYELYDIIKIERSNEFSFTSSKKELNDDNNLIVKAKNLLEKKFSRKLPVKIHLEKNIPIGAGLGGGSSNAASVLLALNDMFNLGMKKEILIRYALELGSDVPFFIKAKPSIGESRGEILTDVNLNITKPFLIVNPGIHISTKEAFANIKLKESKIDYKTISEDDLNNISLFYQLFKNDFEEYVFKTYHEIRDIKNLMIDKGALFSLMSGSGSTVYGIFNDIETADNVRKSFPSKYLSMVLEGDF
jgi:4-diphosphocytidyl-2-C-methyl-D-erythritol kinase